MNYSNSNNVHENFFNSKLDSNVKKKTKYNIKEQYNTYSIPIFSDYCNCAGINKQPFRDDEKIIVNKKDYRLKGDGDNNNNSDNNCSSTLEIIEYPLSEKQKYIKTVIENEQNNFDKYLQKYKMPIDIKGDSDDDLYLNEEDLKFNKKGKFKISFQNTNYHYWSKTSSGISSDILLDYDNPKKRFVLLNKTKKYHEELKSKINNFKKLIYQSKERKNEKSQISNKKVQTKNDFKCNINLKEKKNEKSDINLKEKKNENSTAKDTSISDISGKKKYYDFVNDLNNYTIKSNEISNKKGYIKTNKKTNTTNNLKEEQNNKNLIKEDNMVSSKVIDKDFNNNHKIYNTKKLNQILSKTKRSISTNKKIISNREQINNDQKDKQNIEYNSVVDINSNNKDKNNESMKLKNNYKITNQKTIYELNHIFTSTNHKKLNKKNEKIKTDKMSSNKIVNHNPFKEELINKKDNKVYSKEIFIKKCNNQESKVPKKDE